MIFNKHCISCHGNKLKGRPNLGSDLTDNVWANGGSREELIHTVTHGIVDKGMVPWKSLLSPSEIQSVVSYILSQADD